MLPAVRGALPTLPLDGMFIYSGENCPNFVALDNCITGQHGLDMLLVI